jgi:hypothetical protein
MLVLAVVDSWFDGLGWTVAFGLAHVLAMQVFGFRR